MSITCVKDKKDFVTNCNFVNIVKLHQLNLRVAVDVQTSTTVGYRTTEGFGGGGGVVVGWLAKEVLFN